MNLATRNFSLLKPPTACLFLTEEALSGIPQQLGHHVHILMACVGRGKVRESPAALNGAGISKDVFLFFKISFI